MLLFKFVTLPSYDIIKNKHLHILKLFLQNDFKCYHTSYVTIGQVTSEFKQYVKIILLCHTVRTFTVKLMVTDEV